MSHHPTCAYVGFGANLGDAAQAFVFALDRLKALPDTRIASHSPLYRSAPVGVENHPDYTNAVIALDTTLPPLALLRALLAIERDGGRTRGRGTLPRTLDLDLLMYGEVRMTDPELTLPHPRMHERAFVLRPLADIAPGLVVPGRGPVSALLKRVSDQTLSPL